MALSFEESKKQALKQAATPMVMAATDAAYNDVETFMRDMTGRYAWFSDYVDSDVSVIDKNKSIAVNNSQVHLSQESNSQFVPFEMPRKYDGIDLVDMAISIHFTTSDEQHFASTPVNVEYSNEKIRFAWLVDTNATHIDGVLQFEIHADGFITDTSGARHGYRWKTKSTDKFNVLKSLCQDPSCEPIVVTDDWVQEIVENVAQSVANKIGDAHANLANYYTKSEVDSKVTSVETNLTNYAKKSDVPTKTSQLINDSGYLTTHQDISNLATTAYVDEKISEVDVSDQLTDYALKSELPVMPTNVSEFVNDAGYLTEHQSLEGLATEMYVNEKVAAVDVSEQLQDYAKSTDVYTKSEVDAKVANVEVDLTGYYTKEEVDSKTNANSTNISALSGTVQGLQQTVNSIDTSPRKTYDVVYNDADNPDVGENVFVLYEIENEGLDGEIREAKQKFTIVGGSGGGATSSTLKIEYITKTPLVVTVQDKAVITYKFSGTDSSGDEVLEGNATWKVAGRVVATNTAVSGENSFDLTEYLTIGTQKINLSITDEAGSLVSKTWTVQKVDVRLESTFNDKLTYPIGTVSFDYTPYGAIQKTVHFKLDGIELGTVDTAASGVPMGYAIPVQTHGAHLFEVYMTAEVNNNVIESNHIFKDIIWYDSTSTVPVIGCVQQDFTARQYDATNIMYTVYDPTTETPTVTLAVDGNVVSTLTIDGNTQIWQYKTDEIGPHVLTITCGETVKTLNVTIEKLDIEVEPVMAGLVFDFNPSGRSNNDADRLWSDDDVTMTVSDNFDWVNGGYQIDENGDQYFCIKAGTSAEINYLLFADDAKKNGKEMKLVFKTTNVAKPDATFLSCMDNTTGSDYIGIQMDVHEANIYGQAADCLNLPYSEEDIIEFEFNISKDTEAISMVMGYEDGVSTRPMVYDGSYNFTQNTPKTISLGSNDCDLHIYRFKVYNTSLTDIGILNNFIADARNAEEMISRYERNQIYDENGQLDPDVLAEKCPWLRVYKVSAPYFTNNKSDKVPNTTIQQIYKDGDAILDNWTCYNSQHSGQGTSSNNYGAAGRNLDFIMNKSGISNVDPYFILGDGSRTNKITLTRTSVPTNYLNAKVNIASSNNMTNAMLTNRYNEFNPYKRPFVRDENVNTSFIKDTMEFHNGVIFIQETNEDLSTHREFADNDWHFYGICNIGDSKKSDKTRLTDMNDKYECCVEIMDVELPLSDFPVDTMINAMGYTEDSTTHEKTYTWAKNENLGILYEKVDGEYVLTQDRAIDFSKTYYVDILEHDDFSEDYTYGWRYIYEDGTDEENAEVFNTCKQKWIELYRFITTSTDEEFKARFDEYFVKDTALYYFLFANRYCLVDNLAKNSFWHYGKTNEVDSNGDPIRKWDLTWGYDMDTAIGLNNYGKQVYRYGLETIDTDETGQEVFRESDSTFFCRVRDLFAGELKSMYNTLESRNAWHAESFINKADEWQSEFPEELWRLDIARKYLRTYNSSFINGKGDAQFLVNMANGKMKYHRRQWERSQEKYMASKYQSSVASSDNSVFRCSVPTGVLAVQPNYRLKLTPYAYMYLNVKYGTQSPIQLRAEPNIEYEIPFEGDKADIVDIYSSSLIQDFGDLSSCYVATADTSKASKVKQLIFGNATEGYDNPNFTTLTTGANYLLEKLNIENVSGLTQSLDLSALNNLKELYAHGSNIGGVAFADGGRIEIAELPAINVLTMKNLIYLATLDIVNLNKLTALTAENCNTIDLITILDSAPNINRVRIAGVDWTLDNTSLLERLYEMKGFDKNGYNTDRSVLAGKVHVPIIRQQQLYEYNAAWSDLEISYNTLVAQYKVEFKNKNGDILDVQYVDKGSKPVDPLTREDDPIATPTLESTVSTDYTFAGWDTKLTDVFADTVILATYTETTRKYTVKYMSNNNVLKTITADYGSIVTYDGDLPTYTAEEGAYKYYLFDKWDKGGYVNGDKTINAVFDSCEYVESYFEGKELENMRPVEIYMMVKLNTAGVISITDYIEAKDVIKIQLGNDVNYSDITEQVLISEKTIFNGNNYVDTGINLLSEDRDFVLAIDCKLDGTNSNNAVLVQCFSGLDASGFKLMYKNGASLVWGSSSNDIVAADHREMLVLRHIKGENGLRVYASNVRGDASSYVELSGSHSMTHNVSLVFGCGKMEDGSYEEYATGTVYWSKIWYADLGDDVCKQIADWPHEEFAFETCFETNGSSKRYYLSDNSGSRSTLTLISATALSQPMAINKAGTNEGGWENYSLNTYLNNRVYNAFSVKWKQLIKQVKVKSSVGNNSTSLSSADCYIFIPAIAELSSLVATEPYISEGTLISHFQTNESRICYTADGDAVQYWTRSPTMNYSNYVYRISASGATQSITQASQSDVYVRVMISI